MIEVKKPEIECENGIFEYITKESNGNFYACKDIEVKTDSVNGGRIYNLFDKTQKTEFPLFDQQNVYILIDFKNKKINLSKYYFSVPVEKNGNYTRRPKSWLIDGSNDNISWDLIDKKENGSSLSDYGMKNTFYCNNGNNNFYRFIRITGIMSHSCNRFFLLSEIEFYGSFQKIE